MKIFDWLHKIYEKSLLMLTGLVRMSPVGSGKLEYKTNRKV
jgi:hypothetical protein